MRFVVIIDYKRKRVKLPYASETPHPSFMYKSNRTTTAGGERRAAKSQDQATEIHTIKRYYHHVEHGGEQTSNLLSRCIYPKREIVLKLCVLLRRVSVWHGICLSTVYFGFVYAIFKLQCKIQRSFCLHSRATRLSVEYIVIV